MTSDGGPASQDDTAVIVPDDSGSSGVQTPEPNTARQLVLSDSRQLSKVTGQVDRDLAGLIDSRPDLFSIGVNFVTASYVAEQRTIREELGRRLSAVEEANARLHDEIANLRVSEASLKQRAADEAALRTPRAVVSAIGAVVLAIGVEQISSNTAVGWILTALGGGALVVAQFMRTSR